MIDYQQATSVEGTRSGTSSGDLLKWARDTVAAIRIIRVPLLISLAAVVALALPEQTLEVYRALAQNVVGSLQVGSPQNENWHSLVAIAARVPEIAFGATGLMAMALCIWYAAHRLIQSQDELTGSISRTADWILRLAPMLCATLPLLALSKGLLDAGRFEGVDQGELITNLQNLADQKQAERVTILWSSLGAFKSILEWAAVLCVGVAVSVFLLTSALSYWASSRKGAVDISKLEIAACWLSFFCIAAAAMYFPVKLPQTIGVLAIIGLFFGSLTLIACQLNGLAQKSHVPVVLLVVLAALLFSALDVNDNHIIRGVDHDGQALSKSEFRASDVARLPDAREQFQKWYHSRADKDQYKRYPVYIVAAQGGGIYAATHTVLFLALMQQTCPKFAQHTFAISSVSGGSVGAAWFAALANKFAYNTNGLCPQINFDADNTTEIYQRAMALSAQDYLSPLVSAALFPDFLQRFVPRPMPLLSRARVFEQTLQDVWEQVVADPERGSPALRNPLSAGFLGLWDPLRSTPALLINTTEVGSGRRRVIAPFKFALEDKGDDDIAFLPITPDHDIPLSAAVSLSARFPWVTPAGWFQETKEPGVVHKVRLADGGYSDNSGVATAIELMDTLAEVRAPGTDEPLPVDINLIVLTTGGYAVQKFFGFGEALSPIQSLLNARRANTFVTVRRANHLLELTERMGSKPLADGWKEPSRLRTVDVSDFIFRLPLGWRLSQSTTNLIEMQSGHGGHCVPDDGFKQSFQSFSYFSADCTQRLIYHELAGDNLREAAERLRATKIRTTPAERCTDAGTLRSVKNFVSRTLVLFINDTATLKKVYWIDYKGEEVFYQDIAAGDARQQETFLSHPWLVKNQDGTCFGVFIPRPGQFEVWFGSHDRESPAERCANIAPFRSVRGFATPTTVRFINDTSTTKKLYWLNYDGQQVLYGEVLPGQAHPQETFLSHPWLVTELGGACVGIFLPAPGRTEIRLAGKGP